MRKTAKRRLTLALVGAGRWGSNIRRTLEALAGCQLKYVETTAWRRLLRVPDLDGILIATPASTHAEIALPFIKRGLPTFVEKPMTTSLRDAFVLQRAATRSGALVFVGHVHLYNPAYLAAKRVIQHAGRIRWILGEGMNNGPYRADISALWDWAPHDLSLALDLLQQEPLAVRAFGHAVLRPTTRLHDVAVLAVRFPQGKQFLGVYSWLAPEKRKKLTVVGARDTVVYDDTAEKKITLYHGLGPTVRSRTIVRREPTVSYPSYDTTPPLTAELSAFLTMIRTKQPPRSPLSQGLQTIEILDAAERSIRASGRTVRLSH